MRFSSLFEIGRMIVCPNCGLKYNVSVLYLRLGIGLTWFEVRAPI